MRTQLLASVVVALCSCSGGGGEGGGGTTPSKTATIGAAGGVLEDTSPGSPLAGVRLTIPPGALTDDVDFTMTAVGAGVPFEPIIGVTIEPAGTAFAVPAVLELPYGFSAPVGQERLLRVFGTEAGVWEELAALDRDVVGDVVSVEVDHLSSFILTPPFQLLGPLVRVHIDMTGSGLPAEAAGTIFAAIESGPWAEGLACLGWTISEVTSVDLADVRVRWQDFGATGMSASGQGAFEIMTEPVPTSPQGPFDICFNSAPEDGSGAPLAWLVDPALVPAMNEIDLYTVAAHEFAHALGLPKDHFLLSLKSLPGAGCVAVPYSESALISAVGELGMASAIRALHEFDEAFFTAAYPLAFGMVSPMGSAGFGAVSIRFEASTDCSDHALDLASATLAVDDARPDGPFVFEGVMAGTASPDEKTATFQLDLPPGALADGRVDVVATVADVCGHRRCTSWSFTVGGTPTFSETWSTSPLRTYTPGTIIPGSAASWFLEDTVSEFPECGSTPHRGVIEGGPTGNRLRLISHDSFSSCADNIYAAALTNVALTPGTLLTFDATSDLVAPTVNAFNKHLGDRVFLAVLTNQGHVIFYTLDHADGLVPFDGPSGVFDVDKEFFLEPSFGQDSYLRDVYSDFAALDGFAPGARVTSLVFSVHEHGQATIDNLRFSSPELR